MDEQIDVFVKMQDFFDALNLCSLFSGSCIWITESMRPVEGSRTTNQPFEYGLGCSYLYKGRPARFLGAFKVH